MIDFQDIHIWAVLVATAASMLIGYFWYSMGVFGRPWMMMIGKTEEDLKKGAGPAMGIAVVLAFVTMWTLAQIMAHIGIADWMDGLVAGAGVWLGLILTTIWMQNVFAQRPMKLTVINAGYHLVQLLVAGAIIGGWQ